MFFDGRKSPDESTPLQIPEKQICRYMQSRPRKYNEMCIIEFGAQCLCRDAAYVHVETRHTCQKLLQRIGFAGFDCDNNSIGMVAEAELRREEPPGAFTAVIDVFSKEFEAKIFFRACRADYCDASIRVHDVRALQPLSSRGEFANPRLVEDS